MLTMRSAPPPSHRGNEGADRDGSVSPPHVLCWCPARAGFLWELPSIRRAIPKKKGTRKGMK